MPAQCLENCDRKLTMQSGYRTSHVESTPAEFFPPETECRTPERVPVFIIFQLPGILLTKVCRRKLGKLPFCH
jgi:hypothetical protein